jgi:hypothetical protein
MDLTFGTLMTGALGVAIILSFMFFPRRRH